MMAGAALTFQLAPGHLRLLPGRALCGVSLMSLWILRIALLILVVSVLTLFYRFLRRRGLDLTNLITILGAALGVWGVFLAHQLPDPIIEKWEEVVPPAGLVLVNVSCADILDDRVEPLGPHYNFYIKNNGLGYAETVSVLVTVPTDSTGIAAVAVLTPSDLECAPSAQWSTKLSPHTARPPSSLRVELSSLGPGDRFVVAVQLSPLRPGSRNITVTVGRHRLTVPAQAAERKPPVTSQPSTPTPARTVIVVCSLGDLASELEQLRGDAERAGVELEIRNYRLDEDVIANVRNGRCQLFMLPYSNPIRTASVLVLYRIAYVHPFVHMRAYDSTYKKITTLHPLRLALPAMSLSRRHAEALGFALYGTNPCTGPPGWDCPSDKPVAELQRMWEDDVLDFAVVSDIIKGERARAFASRSSLFPAMQEKVNAMNRYGSDVYFFVRVPRDCLAANVLPEDPVGMAAVPILLGALTQPDSGAKRITDTVAAKSRWNARCDGDALNNLIVVIPFR